MHTAINWLIVKVPWLDPQNCPECDWPIMKGALNVDHSVVRVFHDVCIFEKVSSYPTLQIFQVAFKRPRDGCVIPPFISV